MRWNLLERSITGTCGGVTWGGSFRLNLICISERGLKTQSRSSRPEVFCKKGVLRNFTKFIGKHLCQSLLFNRVAGLSPTNLLKKRFWHRCFPVNFVKFLRTPFLIEHLWCLPLTTAYNLLITFFCHAELHITRSSYHTPFPNIYLSTVDICDGFLTGGTQFLEFQVLSLSCGDVIVM